MKKASEMSKTTISTMPADINTSNAAILFAAPALGCYINSSIASKAANNTVQADNITSNGVISSNSAINTKQADAITYNAAINTI